MREFKRNRRTGIVEVWENGKKIGPILTMETAMAAAGEEGGIYKVIELDEDVATLKCLSSESDKTKDVSRYYLPSEIKIGTRLKYENMSYEIGE